MTLIEALNKYKGYIGKIGSHTAFMYCDKISNETIDFFTRAGKRYSIPFLNRKVKEIYDSHLSEKIIIIEGNENGRFWTTEEFAKYKNIPTIRFFSRKSNYDAIEDM